MSGWPSVRGVIVVLDNVRSAYNVGAILRTLDAVGGEALVCCGITPYPDLGEKDSRSPVVRTSNAKQIAKSALGAEDAMEISHATSALSAVESLQLDTFVVALEQSDAAVDLFEIAPPAGRPIALMLGSETDGIDPAVLAMCDAVAEIPMRGTKESLNVSVAAGIALYHLDRARM